MLKILASLGLTHLFLDAIAQILIVKNIVATGQFLFGKRRIENKTVHLILKEKKAEPSSFKQYRTYGK